MMRTGTRIASTVKPHLLPQSAVAAPWRHISDRRVLDVTVPAGWNSAPQVYGDQCNRVPDIPREGHTASAAGSMSDTAQPFGHATYQTSPSRWLWPESRRTMRSGVA